MHVMCIAKIKNMKLSIVILPHISYIIFFLKKINLSMVYEDKK